MHIQTVPYHRVRDFNMVKAVLLVALMGVGFCLTSAQRHDDFAARNDDIQSMVVPAVAVQMAEPTLPGVLI